MILRVFLSILVVLIVRDSSRVVAFPLRPSLTSSSTAGGAAAAWWSRGRHSSPCYRGQSPSLLRQATEAASDNDNDNDSFRLQRTQFAGVSVSPTGFTVLLQVGPDSFLPVRVTEDDRTGVVTSPEALTILQLLANVDMAGAILPPDVLGRLVVMECVRTANTSANNSNSNNNNTTVQPVAAALALANQVDLPAGERYSDLSAWAQSRIRLPLCTVDQVQLEVLAAGTSEDGTTTTTTTPDRLQFTYTCSVKGSEHFDGGSLSLQPSPDGVNEVTYNKDHDDPCVSLAFLSLALALRYKAPVVWKVPTVLAQPPLEADFLVSRAQLAHRFPLYRSNTELDIPNTRASSAVTTGLQVHQLQAALRIAMQKGDLKAAAKIRIVLDEKDSLQDLPVQPDSDVSTMQ
jgi:hypothetical protein